MQQNNIILSFANSYGTFNRQSLAQFIDQLQPEIIVFTIAKHSIVNTMSQNNAFISYSDSQVLDISTSTIPNSKQIAEFYWFATGNIFKALDYFVFATAQPTIIDFLHMLLSSGSKIMHYPLDSYINLANNNTYQAYKFWSNYNF